MKKFVAIIIFYDWTFTKQDTKKILRIQRFVRREHLPVIGDKLECIAGRPFYLSAGEFDEDSIPDSQPMCEHRYILAVSATNLVRMHVLVSLLEAYAAYCGIHSRLFSMKEKECP